MTILKFQSQGDKQNLVEKQSLPDTKTEAENSQNEQRRKRDKQCAVGLSFLLFVLILGGSFYVWFCWPQRIFQSTFHNPELKGKFIQIIEYDPMDKSIVKIRVSKLSDFSKTSIVRDFTRNLAAIADFNLEKCFVFPIGKQSRFLQLIFRRFD